jgi:hypothetical protein
MAGEMACIWEQTASAFWVVDGQSREHIFLLLELTRSFIGDFEYRSACLYRSFSFSWQREDNAWGGGFDGIQILFLGLM